jgi:hypothetical protein
MPKVAKVQRSEERIVKPPETIFERGILKVFYNFKWAKIPRA